MSCQILTSRGKGEKKFFWAYLIHTHSIAMFSILIIGPTVGVQLVQNDLNYFSDTIRVIFQLRRLATNITYGLYSWAH